MKHVAAVAVALGACDPSWALRAKVRAPDGAPVPEAVLAVTCAPSGSERRGLAAASDERGEVVIGLIGWLFPEGCSLTIAKPGFRTWRNTFEKMCAPKRVDDCGRFKQIEVVLEPDRAPGTPPAPAPSPASPR